MVYFIAGEDTKLVKIGKAQNVVRRLRDLQAASPDKLTVLAVILNEDDDHKYHRQFAAGAWSHAEWFARTPELLAFIGSIPESEYTGLCIRIGNIHAQDVGDSVPNPTWTNSTPPYLIPRAPKVANTPKPRSPDALVAIPRLRREDMAQFVRVSHLSDEQRKSEIVALLALPTRPDTIERLRAEMAQAYLHDGELEAALDVLLGLDDEDVREYMLGE